MFFPLPIFQLLIFLLIFLFPPLFSVFPLLLLLLFLCFWLWIAVFFWWVSFGSIISFSYLYCLFHFPFLLCTAYLLCSACPICLKCFQASSPCPTTPSLSPLFPPLTSSWVFQVLLLFFLVLFILFPTLAFSHWVFHFLSLSGCGFFPLRYFLLFLTCFHCLSFLLLFFLLSSTSFSPFTFTDFLCFPLLSNAFYVLSPFSASCVFPLPPPLYFQCFSGVCFAFRSQFQCFSGFSLPLSIFASNTFQVYSLLSLQYLTLSFPSLFLWYHLFSLHCHFIFTPFMFFLHLLTSCIFFHSFDAFHVLTNFLHCFLPLYAILMSIISLHICIFPFHFVLFSSLIFLIFFPLSLFLHLFLLNIQAKSLFQCTEKGIKYTH